MVTAAAGEDDLATSMWLVTLLALVAVALLLAVLSRSIEAALLVAIPLTLAVGWAFLILFLLPVDVDFLTAALGAIVVAICAGPLCSAARGYRDARAGGLATDAAVEQLRERRAATSSRSAPSLSAASSRSRSATSRRCGISVRRER